MSDQLQNAKLPDEDMSLKDVILSLNKWSKILLSKWFLIVGMGLLGACLGFAYAFIKKPIYIATTTFVLEDEKGVGSLGNLAGLASMAGLDLNVGGGGIFQGDNILGLYKSRTMIEKTLLKDISYNGKRSNLVERYIVFNNLREKWNNRPELLKLNFRDSSLANRDKFFVGNRLRDSILGSIVIDINKNYLSVAKPDKKLSTIQVDVKATDEIFAKSFNDELVKNVSEFYIQTKTKKSLENVLILQQKTDSVRSVMNGAIYKAAAVTDATPNLNPTRQTQRAAPVQQSQFSAETNKSILSELVKNLELSKISLRKEVPLIQVVDQPIYPLTIQKLSKIKALILGGGLFSLMTVIIIIVKTVLRNTMLY